MADGPLDLQLPPETSVLEILSPAGDLSLVVYDRIDTDRRLAVVQVGGEVDDRTAAGLRNRLLALCRTGAVDRIHVDLLAAGFFGAAGVTCLVAASDTGVEVVVNRPSAFVRRIMTLSGVTDLIRVETVEPPL